MLGTFNRGIRHEARAPIARTFGEAVGVAPPYPDSFPGGPVLNNLNSWFISWESWFISWEAERGPHDVDFLWDLCRAAMEYADHPGESTREQLLSVRRLRHRGHP